MPPARIPIVLTAVLAGLVVVIAALSLMNGSVPLQGQGSIGLMAPPVTGGNVGGTMAGHTLGGTTGGQAGTTGGSGGDACHCASDACVAYSGGPCTPQYCGLPCNAMSGPVCGCDGVTYPSECAAKQQAHLVSWTPGACGGGGGSICSTIQQNCQAVCPSGTLPERWRLNVRGLAVSPNTICSRANQFCAPIVQGDGEHILSFVGHQTPGGFQTCTWATADRQSCESNEPNQMRLWTLDCSGGANCMLRGSGYADYIPLDELCSGASHTFQPQPPPPPGVGQDCYGTQNAILTPDPQCAPPGGGSSSQASSQASSSFSLPTGGACMTGACSLCSGGAPENFRVTVSDAGPLNPNQCNGLCTNLNGVFTLKNMGGCTWRIEDDADVCVFGGGTWVLTREERGWILISGGNAEYKAPMSCGGEATLFTRQTQGLCQEPETVLVEGLPCLPSSSSSSTSSLASSSAMSSAGSSTSSAVSSAASSAPPSSASSSSSPVTLSSSSSSTTSSSTTSSSSNSSASTTLALPSSSAASSMPVSSAPASVPSSAQSSGPLSVASSARTSSARSSKEPEVFELVPEEDDEVAIATSVCGDGRIEGKEKCDDGNHVLGDGCAVFCAVEWGWNCDGEPSSCYTTCGDGLAIAREECDDGNDNVGDGCTPDCTIEDRDAVLIGPVLPGSSAAPTWTLPDTVVVAPDASGPSDANKPGAPASPVSSAGLLAPLTLPAAILSAPLPGATASHSPVGATGPAAVAVIATGAAAGYAWIRRRRL